MKLQKALGGFVGQFPFCKCVLALLLPAASGLAQGTFQDLDFESPTFVPVSSTYSPSSVDPVAALPGWTAYWGTSLAPYILYDEYFLDSRGISIFDGNPVSPSAPLEGQYSLLLQGGFTLAGPGVRVSASVAQTGLIPSWANSLTFQVGLGSESFLQYFEVSVAGQTLQNFWGKVNISPFSGQEVEIRFTAYPRPYPGLAINNIVLDNIAFSAEVVPEPRTQALFALTLLLLCFGSCRHITRVASSASGRAQKQIPHRGSLHRLRLCVVG